MLAKNSRARVKYDISCDAYTIPKGTEVIIANFDILFGTYDINLDDGRWMNDIEKEALEPIE